jgi:hypothetical protein
MSQENVETVREAVEAFNRGELHVLANPLEAVGLSE